MGTILAQHMHKGKIGTKLVRVQELIGYQRFSCRPIPDWYCLGGKSMKVKTKINAGRIILLVADGVPISHWYGTARVGRATTPVLHQGRISLGLCLIAAWWGLAMESGRECGHSMTAEPLGCCVHLGVTGVIEGKFTVSYNWPFINRLRWSLTRRDTTGYAVQYGYISLGVWSNV